MEGILDRSSTADSIERHYAHRRRDPGPRAYAPKTRRAEYEKAVDRAATWLMKAQPSMTDERALQLLGLTWAGVKPGHDVMRKRARELLAEQRSDGGWAQLPSLTSDAYATGQALVALKEAGALRVSDAAYTRGVRLLLNTQTRTWLWYVKSRPIAFQPYFESDFPHGADRVDLRRGDQLGRDGPCASRPVRSPGSPGEIYIARPASEPK